MNKADTTPEALVATVMVEVLLLNFPDAPVSGAVNVTLTPDTGLWAASVTTTARALVKAELIVADCGVPAISAIEDAAPAMLVREKLTVVRPVAAAATV